jgi:hypothetical protein
MRRKIDGKRIESDGEKGGKRARRARKGAERKRVVKIK